MRTVVRRKLARRLRERVRDIWPIMPGSGSPPDNWIGWPEGKRFALVLTHDVEGQSGLMRCRELMQMEQDLGFRSSFNFIPEGKYVVPRALREELAQEGFEVGVHDLKHDGRLFRSHRDFMQKASRINHYVREWGAVGFRSGFMLHNLDWLHELDIDYDLSTFDTDPFEPQPEGRNTIFPFWIKRPALSRSSGSTRSGGYSELPYTLPQDSTLFLLLQERSIDIWKQKVDWIAQRGGMMLLNTHPDYMAMRSKGTDSWEYPARFYQELLCYIRSKYESEYWHVLPREAAHFVQLNESQNPATKATQSANGSVHRRKKLKIWIDLDNTPHVPFFEPIAEELKSRGFPLLVTARDAFQVCDLADKKNFPYLKVGRHYGKHRLLKGAGLMYRSLQLAPIILREKPVLAISHGARSQLLLGNWLRIPTVLMEDYEYCQFPPMMRASWLIAPAVIPDESLPFSNGNVRKYNGIKEDVYAWKFQPDARLLGELGLTERDLIVTVRPPATEAHYHNPESEALFERFMDRACRVPEIKIVLLPRNPKQGALIRRQWPTWFADDKTVIPTAAIDGLNLMWHSDLVVSGGGTMNREAAALGVPVYSIFRGTIGAVDRHLCNEGRLVLVDSVKNVDRMIPIVRRLRRPISEITSKQTLHTIVDTIQEIAEATSPRS
jgi:predicted glycosyltransferase